MWAFLVYTPETTEAPPGYLVLSGDAPEGETRPLKHPIQDKAYPPYRKVGFAAPCRANKVLVGFYSLAILVLIMILKILINTEKKQMMVLF